MVPNPAHQRGLREPLDGVDSPELHKQNKWAIICLQALQGVKDGRDEN